MEHGTSREQRATTPGEDSMKSTGNRVGRPCRSISLILAIAIAVNGCAAGVVGVQQSGLDRLRDQPEVLVVHYEPPPPFLVMQPRRVGRAMAIAAGVALFTLPIALVDPVSPRLLGNHLQAEMEKAEGEAAGDLLTREIPLQDPVVRVKDGLISGLSAEGGLGRIRPAATAMDSDDLKSLKHVLGSVTVFDVRTTNWGLYPHSIDPKTFLVLYSVKARLIRLDQEQVLWRGEVGCLFAGDRRFGLPTLDDLKADGGSLLKTLIAGSADNCVSSLLARFRGEQPPMPIRGSDEPETVTVEPATLEQAQAKLFGPSGLVEGSRRFKAKFQRLTLTAQDLPRLRTMMKDATAAPWRSEVQFRGTIDGVAFKAEMEKGSVGRSEFTFEGLRFEDKERASDFLAPLQGRGVREVKLVGVAGDRPIKIILTPSSAVAAKVDEVDPSRGLMQEPHPSSETTARTAPDSAVSQPARSTASAGPPEGGTSSVQTQLERLSNLKARGDITEDEYMTLRRRLLGTAVSTPERPAVAAPNTTAQAPAAGLTPMPQDLVTRPIQGAKSIVGTWEGFVLVPNSGLTLYTLTLRDNGTWEAATLVPPGRYFGSYTVSAGKARFKSDTTGRTGSYELREGGGRRVLVLTPDGREIPAFELVPARAREPWRPAKSADDAAKQNACRRQHLEGFTDWRDRLPEYRACLAR